MRPTHAHDIMRERIMAKAGLLAPPARKTTQQAFAELEELMRTEWNQTFVDLMRNRLVMGAIRYGSRRAHEGDKSQDLMGKLSRKLVHYYNTGNAELLVDIANYALLEFERGTHPNYHWNALDDECH